MAEDTTPSPTQAEMDAVMRRLSGQPEPKKAEPEIEKDEDEKPKTRAVEAEKPSSTYKTRKAD